MKFSASRNQIGQSVRRVEDARLVTGRGRYADDVQPAGLAYGVTLRSPYPHARMTRIDAAEARAMPGVLAILTADDMDGYDDMPCMFHPKGAAMTPRPILARDTVRYVGEPVAFVVAEDRARARAAIEAIVVDFDPLPAVGSIEAAVAEGAPTIWPDAPNNVVFDWRAGDEAATQGAIAAAAHVVRLRVVQPRVAPNSMEVRALVAAYDPTEGFTLYSGSQSAVGLQQKIAGVMKLDAEKLRVITQDVGGGFGMKWFVYPEHILALHAARLLGRPVKWTGERSDAFQSDAMGRDLLSDITLGLDADGRFLALDVHTWSGLGAYQHQMGSAIQTLAGGLMVGGLYRIPAIHNRVEGVATNTTPTDAYRGAGRPEAAYITERAVDAAARALGLAPDEIRRRNLLQPGELPYTNALGTTFDVGDYGGLLDKALAAADWSGFTARKHEAAGRGLLLGRGLCFYVEIAGGGGAEEFADVRVDADGLFEVAVGTQSNGQGHETAYAQVFAARLGVPVEQVRIVQGDTSRLEVGHGTGGSRSLQWGGGACLEAADAVIAKGKALAAQSLETQDVDYADGLFQAVGSNRTISLAELASRFPGRLDARGHYQTKGQRPTFPNGCHIAEVAIDPQTGHLEVTRYSVVDDFGTIVNPMLVEGQVHGGVAQGLGQALMERMVYDEDAQLLTGSFMDYGLPRATDMPLVRFDTAPVPNPNNPLGVKGCGEAGAIGAPAALIHAIIDALDGQPIDMPATPEKIWRAAQRMKRSQAA